MSAKKEIAIYAVIIILGLLLAQHMNVVVSESMEPVFFRGDIVVVEKTNFIGIPEFDSNDVQIGDIVVYNAVWFPNPVIHRIIGETTVATGISQNGSMYSVINGTVTNGKVINGTVLEGAYINGTTINGTSVGTVSNGIMVSPDGSQDSLLLDESSLNETKYFLIKGDNNPVPDPVLASPDQITERVLKIGGQPIIIPKIGYITIWLRGL